MIYVMSDLHGCYDLFIKMLNKIRFCDQDRLYVLGDVVDRGEHGIALALEIMKRKNVMVLRGNHDHTAYLMLKYLDLSNRSAMAEQVKNLYSSWMKDGGEPTYKEYQRLDHADQKKILSFLNRLPVYEEICVNHKSFFLAHTVPEKEKMKLFDSCKMIDFMMGEPEYEQEYFSDTYIVTGHTPTGFIDEKYIGRIWQKNHHIAVDCGAVFGNPLGCICLDTMEEFYAE